MSPPLKGVSQSFIDRADSAAFYEAWVGAVLARAGLYTLHHPFEIDGKDHGETFDLGVFKNNLQPWYEQPGNTVEVKSLNLTFYNPDTYPFEEVLVCSQNSWLRKWPGRYYTMRDFLFVSRATGSIVWLPTMTQVTLGKDVEDKGRGEVYKAVTVQREALRPLQEFVDHVKGD